MTVLAVEDDKVLRLLQLLLDPDTPHERVAAWTDYVAHDADLERWRVAVRARAPGVFPAKVRLVSTQEELRAGLPGADALVMESLNVGDAELAAGDRLALVQKSGIDTRAGETAAPAQR